MRDSITIAPRSRLTPEQMRTIAVHKDALKGLLRDDDVVARRAEFAQQLACTPAPSVPAFLFTTGVTYTKGICFSCGDVLSRWTFGRCWRCSLAWRLTRALPISADLAQTLDEARSSAGAG